MHHIKGFSLGFQTFFKAIPFIFRHKLWWTFFIPIALSLTLYFLGFSVINHLGDTTRNFLDTWLTNDSTSKTITILVKILGSITRVIFQIIFFLLFYHLSGYVILMLLSPLFAWVSEKTDNLLNEVEYPFSWNQFFKDIWRGIIIALRNLFYELGVSALLLILTLIPVIRVIATPVSVAFLFFLSAYFYGFSYMDYTNERKKLKVKESIAFIRKYKAVAITNGGLFSVSLFIPVLGGITAIIATVGATLAMNEIPEIKYRVIEPTVKKHDDE